MMIMMHPFILWALRSTCITVSLKYIVTSDVCPTDRFQDLDDGALRLVPRILLACEPVKKSG